MTVTVSKLASGLTVATDPMDGLQSAALGVWVDCGTRHERPAQMGLSHMLEHMAFKGTERRTAKDIAVEIESVGGDLNAFTSREQTAYHARVLRNDVPLALDILSDILLAPSFAEQEIARERDVIIQEIGQTQDTPDDLVFDYLQMACFPDQAMGWPILGTSDIVAGYRREDIVDYMASHYRAGAMTVIAAGAVRHDTVMALAERHFAPLQVGPASVATPAHFVAHERRHVEDLEQAHLAFAFEGVRSADPDAIAAQVFAVALGGGMSSRLFQEAREKRGLCYAISAFSHPYRDTGLLGIYAGTSDAHVAQIAPLVAGEMEALAAGANEDETARARAQLKASVLMGLESPAARCERIATHLHAFGRILSMEELIARIDTVDAAAVRKLATRICEGAQPALAAIGPVSCLESRDRFAARFGSGR